MAYIAKNDMFIEDIQDIIENRKKLLLDKFKELNKTMEENDNLINVYSDNLSYYETIINDKKKLIKSLNYIVAYLETIIDDSTIAKERREDANREKKEIIKLIEDKENEITQMLYN
jgi:hypothetical protein